MGIKGNNLKKAWEAQVEKTPSLPAVTDGKRSLTYLELNEMADRIAALLPAAEESGQFIGLVMDHSPEMIASILGILKAGYGYVPVEPEFPPERLHYIMKETKARLVLTQEKYRHFFEKGPEPVLIEADRLSGQPGDGRRNAETQEDAPAYVLYTSGSTGEPKGVVVEHQNVCHYVRAFCREFHPGPGDVMLQYSVCTFDIFVEEVFPILLSGGALAIADYGARRDFSRLLDFIKTAGVTIVTGFPYLFIEFNKLETLPDSLRLLISGGDVLRYEYVDRLLSRIEIYNTYGPSETTVCVSYFRCRAASPLGDGTFPVGWEVPGIGITIRDEKLNPLSGEEIGEICITGDGVSRGYLFQEAETRKRFILEPETGKRMYRSGDLGYRRTDGAIVFLKRMDEQVMIEGRRVEPQEVENVLCRSSHVEQAVVVPQRDERNLSYLTAFFVADGPVSLSGLRRELARFLPAYMIPEFFVELVELPQGLNGKVNRNALPRVLKES